MEGSLKKWTNLLNGYQERKFILKGSILAYYTEANYQKDDAFFRSAQSSNSQKKNSSSV